MKKRVVHKLNIVSESQVEISRSRRPRAIRAGTVGHQLAQCLARVAVRASHLKVGLNLGETLTAAGPEPRGIRKLQAGESHVIYRRSSTAVGLNQPFEHRHL